jgi:hypothetical protein
MSRALKLLLCLVFTAISAFAADPTIVGVWTANAHDLPATKMTVTRQVQRQHHLLLPAERRGRLEEQGRRAHADDPPAHGRQ